jgi:hypothetical protein
MSRRPTSSTTHVVYVKAQKAHGPEDCERWEPSDLNNTLSPRDGSAPSTLVFTVNQRDEVRELGDTAAALSATPSGLLHQETLLAQEVSSAGSGGSISDSPGPGGAMPSSASPTPGGDPSSPSTGPESRSTMTSPPSGPAPPSTCSAEASPARTSASPADARDSQELVPASSMSSHESLQLFDLAGYSSRTYPDCSPRTAVGTSESFLERWPTSGTAWAGGLSTAVTSECRSDAAGCSSWEPSLTEILEPPQDVPARYSLSARAAQGILRRAAKRGRTLSGLSAAALESVAGGSGSRSRAS